MLFIGNLKRTTFPAPICDDFMVSDSLMMDAGFNMLEFYSPVALVFGASLNVTCKTSSGGYHFKTPQGDRNFTVTCSHNHSVLYLDGLTHCEGNGVISHVVLSPTYSKYI